MNKHFSISNETDNSQNLKLNNTTNNVDTNSLKTLDETSLNLNNPLIDKDCNIPTIPNIPGIPSIPGVPNIPAVPKIPVIPSVPAIPKISTQPKIQPKKIKIEPKEEIKVQTVENNSGGDKRMSNMFEEMKKIQLKKNK